MLHYRYVTWSLDKINFASYDYCIVVFKTRFNVWLGFINQVFAVGVD